MLQITGGKGTYDSLFNDVYLLRESFSNFLYTKLRDEENSSE